MNRSDLTLKLGDAVKIESNKRGAFHGFVVRCDNGLYPVGVHCDYQLAGDPLHRWYTVDGICSTEEFSGYERIVLVNGVPVVDDYQPWGAHGAYDELDTITNPPFHPLQAEAMVPNAARLTALLMALVISGLAFALMRGGL